MSRMRKLVLAVEEHPLLNRRGKRKSDEKSEIKNFLIAPGLSFLRSVSMGGFPTPWDGSSSACRVLNLENEFPFSLSLLEVYQRNIPNRANKVNFKLGLKRETRMDKYIKKLIKTNSYI